MNLKDNHKQIAEDLTRKGLLGDGKIIGGVYHERRTRNGIDGMFTAMLPSLDPDGPDFDKNANEVMRRWKETEKGRLWFEEIISFFYDKYLGKLTDFTWEVTTPEKWLLMIWEQVKEAK